MLCLSHNQGKRRHQNITAAAVYADVVHGVRRLKQYEGVFGGLIELQMGLEVVMHFVWAVTNQGIRIYRGLTSKVLEMLK